MEIVDLLSEYSIDVVIIAVVVFVLTGIVKIPIKLLAQKIEDSTSLTRFITFLPVILSFGILVCYQNFIIGAFAFDGEFVISWMTSSSASLAIYAFAEKFLLNSNVTLELTEAEFAEIKQRIQSLILEEESVTEEVIGGEDATEEKLEPIKNIILGKKN